MPPRNSFALRTDDRISSTSKRSTEILECRLGSLHDRRTDSSLSWDRARRTRRVPRSAKATAAMAPKPLEAPVIKIRAFFIKAVVCVRNFRSWSTPCGYAPTGGRPPLNPQLGMDLTRGASSRIHGFVAKASWTGGIGLSYSGKLLVFR